MRYILLLCLTTRLTLFLFIQPWESGAANNAVLQRDAIGYHELALSLVSRQAFSLHGQWEALRTPLYPLVISGFYAIFGPQPFVVLFFQIILDTLSCWILFRATSTAFHRGIATAAAGLYAIHPFFILVANTLYSDTLFIFLLLSAFSILVPVFKNKGNATPIALVSAACLVGLAALTRPIAVYIPFLIVILLLAPLQAEKMRMVKLAMLFALAFLATLLPWLWRNQVRFGAFALSTSGAYNAIALFATPMEMEKRANPNREVVQAQLFAEAEAFMRADGLQPEQLNSFEKSVYWQQRAFELIRQAPLSFMKHYSLGVFRLFASLGTGEYASMLQLPNEALEAPAYANLLQLVSAFLERRTPIQLLMGAIIGLYLLFCYGCFVVGLTQLRHFNITVSLLSLLLGLYFVLLTGTGGRPRFSLPIFAFWLPIMGVGMVYLATRLRKTRRPVA